MKKIKLFFRACSKAMLIGFALYGLSIAHCCAQSIVGKWKLASSRYIVTEKASGKKQDISDQVKEMMQMMQTTMEFRTDNTFTRALFFTEAKKTILVTGTYKIAGNQLALNLDPFNKLTGEQKRYFVDDAMNKIPKTITVQSVAANAMVWHVVGETTDDGHTFLWDMESTFQRQ